MLVMPPIPVKALPRKPRQSWFSDENRLLGFLRQPNLQWGYPLTEPKLGVARRDGLKPAWILAFRASKLPGQEACFGVANIPESGVPRGVRWECALTSRNFPFNLIFVSC